MSTIEHCEDQWYRGKGKLIERIFVDSTQPAEPLVKQLCGPEGDEAFRFGVIGLYGRTWDSLDRGVFLGAFREIFLDIALPGLTLLLVRAEADCQSTAEKISGWLLDHGLAMNIAYLSGEGRLSEAQQTRAIFEAAAAEMFFRGSSECRPLASLAPAPRAPELRAEDLHQLRQLRQDVIACLVRGEADCVHKHLEDYFRISAQGPPALFREQCAGLCFRVNEELALTNRTRDAYRGKLRQPGSTVFQLVADANSAAEIMDHVSWYIDRLLAWYRPLRESTGFRVAFFVEEYIREHYMEPVSIEDIAAELGLSANYVRSTFKSIRGQTIHHYLSECRLEAACQLLRDTPLAVGRIGQMVGYNNVSYFCASFQRRYGKTPGEWRQGLQEPHSGSN